MTLHAELGREGYDILIERGIHAKAGEVLDLERKVLVVTDDGVPAVYAAAVCAQCENGYLFTVKQGEQSKSIACFETLLSRMLELGFTRKDCVVAVGGGVVGDLAGFAAASYMRGIDFYNIPTTVLSQVDSSVGGKTAVNLNGIKNVVGAFYQPKCVLIDPDLLKTLPQRQISNGLAESLKMSLTLDKELFSIFENEDVIRRLDTVIERSVMIKKNVVEQDEKESGLRRILNFGHTIGHAIESQEELHGLYHGECVALGMLPMCAPALRERLIPVLKKTGLPTEIDIDEDVIIKAILHDKKTHSRGVTVTFVNAPGEYMLKTMQAEEFLPLLDLIRVRKNK